MCRRLATGVPPVGGLWFGMKCDPANARNNYLEAVTTLRDTIDRMPKSRPLLAAGGNRPRGAKPGLTALGQVKDSIMGLAKKYEFEFRRPSGTDAITDHCEKQTILVDVRYESAAGDPKYQNLFHSQLVPNALIWPVADGKHRGSACVCDVFGISLAGVFLKFGDRASARLLHEAYLTWPIIFAKKTRKPGGYSAWWGQSWGSRWCNRWDSSGWGSNWSSGWDRGWEEESAAGEEGNWSCGQEEPADEWEKERQQQVAAAGLDFDSAAAAAGAGASGRNSCSR